ncbi:MAG TPA: competence protein ComFB [Peptococcaceae bacterium]|nr:competence protein ComFB [Peptococcaceae bacterium]
MEVCVKEFLDDVLKKYPDVCQCDQCRSDIAALALNNLPPKYTTTDLGQIYSKIELLDSQHRTDIYKAVTQAVECVRKNPRHEIKK